jgi:hypothetical protein
MKQNKNEMKLNITIGKCNRIKDALETKQKFFSSPSWWLKEINILIDIFWNPQSKVSKMT